MKEKNNNPVTVRVHVPENVNEHIRAIKINELYEILRYKKDENIQKNSF